MNKIITMLLSAAILTTMLSGCAANTPAPSQGTAEPVQTEAAEPAAQEQAVATEASVAAPEPEKALSEFKSDYGYTISYDEDSFDYRRTEGYDEYILKSDAADKPFVFVCVSRVGAEFVDAMKAAALGENPEDCTIGQAQMQAQCSETKEAWEGGDIIHKTYVCKLPEGDALLIETQWYTEQADDLYAALLWKTVNSIKL